MASFPATPLQFQIYTENDSKREWQWDGRKWTLLDKSFYQARGPQGDIGLRGETGATGSTGMTGDIGEKGEQGKEGDLGPQGNDGLRGERGATGPQGLAECMVVVEPPSSGSIRGQLFISSWNEVYVAIG